MIGGKRVLAIIPARGGSRGVPRKNLQPVAGKPLIAWTVEAARQARCIDRIIVSTDDAEIASVAKRWGCEVPFVRPAALAADSAKMTDVIVHALDALAGPGGAHELFVLLQPTSPLRTGGDIDAAAEILLRQEAESVVSVCPVEHHPFYANTLPADRSLKDFIRPEVQNTNRQELPPYYRLNGAVYLCACDQFRRRRSFFDGRAFALVMPQERSVDIDTESDLALAEVLLQRLHGTTASRPGSGPA